MTVKELIACLEEEDPEIPVVFYDNEWNEYTSIRFTRRLILPQYSGFDQKDGTGKSVLLLY